MWNKEGLQEFRFRNRLMVGGEMGWWWGHSDQLVPPRPGANFQTDPPFPVIALAHLNISAVLGQWQKPLSKESKFGSCNQEEVALCVWETLLLLWERVTWGFAIETPAFCSFWPPWPRVAGPSYFIQVSQQNCISKKNPLHPTCAVLALRGFQPLRSNDLVKWLEGGFQALGMVYVVCYWVLGGIVRRLLEGG